MDSLQLLSSAGEGAGKTALVTGVGGFTGYYVAQELLAAGYRVVGTHYSSRSTAIRDVEVRQLDITDREAICRLVADVVPDVVVHLAAFRTEQPEEIEQIYRVNVAGTSNLLEALYGSALKPSAVLVVSDAEVYGNSSLSVLEEEVELAPMDDYGVSKLSVEYMARLWMDRLPVFVVRPFRYSGLGQGGDSLLPRIVSHFQRKENSIRLPDLALKRDFSDVRMVAAAYRALVFNPPIGQIVNVCSGIGYSLADVLVAMESISGRSLKVEPDGAKERSNALMQIGCHARLSKVVGSIAPVPLEQTLHWMYFG